jgi:hypothetical protein
VSDRAQFVILAEDLQAQVFARRALLERGANPRRIRAVPLPSKTGGGAGHAYVVARYASEVKARRKQHAATALLVHIDADNMTIVDRHRQLAAALAAAGEERRVSDEPIAELVPRRNIETWIYALDDELAARIEPPLDETTAYPKLDYESDCAMAAAVFARHARDHTDPDRAGEVPSLLDGLEELRRLP